MVAEAIDVSQEGGIFTRSARRIGGGELDHAVEPTISYSKKSVVKFVDDVAADVNRDPGDASVQPTAVSLVPVVSEMGRSVDAAKLRKDVEQALQDPGDRRVGLEVEKLKPSVTTDELAAQYPAYITVDRGSFKLRFYKNLKLSKSYTIALGQVGYDTPGGLYHIQNKQVDPVWNVPDSDWAGKLAGTTVPPGPDNPLKARWLGVNGAVGIHGTSDVGSLGTQASHGCIRMSVLDVTDLYDRVPTGTPIYIS
jgi:lipoprotein-anchoring transpeptidase ErfK/SrfK